MKKLLYVFLILISFSFQIKAQTKKLLFIGIDGCRIDAIDVAVCPNLDMLISQGVHSKEGLTLYPTWSGNGWSTMLSGVKHNKHLVTDNSFGTTNFGDYPDFISRIENYDPNMQTYSVVHWSPINDMIIQTADQKINVATDLEVKNEAVDILQNENPDVLFVDFDDVDHTGHSYGFDIGIAEYLSTIETTDSYIGEILNALTSRPEYTSEDWLIMVTTDHGGNMQGHGLGTIEERTIFTTCYNLNLPAQQLTPTTITNLEITPTAHFDNGQYAIAGMPDQYSFGANQDFTIEFWVKTNEGFTGDPAFISNKDWNSGLNEGFVICGQNSSVWKVNIGDGSTRADIQGGYISNAWTHIAVSFDRDGLMKAYENGALIGLADISNIGNINSGLPMVIMQDGTTQYNYNFNGYIRDIRVWNTVIEQEVLTTWSVLPITNSHPNYQSLLSNWPMNSASGTTISDIGTQSTDAILNDDIVWENNEEYFEVKDYSNVPKEEDNAATALAWFCIPIDPLWNLDGKPIIDLCESSVEEHHMESLHITPNPTRGLVKLNTLQVMEEIQVIDILGRSCKTINNNNQIDISDLQNGLYVIRAYSGNRTWIGYCELQK